MLTTVGLMHLFIFLYMGMRDLFLYPSEKADCLTSQLEDGFYQAFILFSNVMDHPHRWTLQHNIWPVQQIEQKIHRHRPG